MDQKMQKKIGIVLGTVLGVGAVGAVGYMVWNSKQLRTARLVHRTNAIVHRIGSALCRLTEANDGML